MTTNIRQRRFTLVWVDERITTDALSSNSRVQGTVDMLKQTTGDNCKFYNDTEHFLSEIEHLSQTVDTIVILSEPIARVTVNKLTESSLMKEINLILIFCPSGQLETHRSLLEHHKVTQICTDDASLKAAVEYEKASSSTFIIYDRHLKPLFNLQDEFEAYAWYRKYLEILRDDDGSAGSKENMLCLCRAWYETNGLQKAEINRFAQTYDPKKAIAWYAKDSFIYRVVNKALRTLDVETINAFRFYIRDLSRQLRELYTLQKENQMYKCLLVYRGIGNMTTLTLDHIQQNVGGLISFNGFTSTTKKFDVAFEFSRSKSTHEAVIWQIHASYNLKNVVFADISQHSEMCDEQEVLFDLCSVFRIVGCYRHEQKQASIIEMIATDEDGRKFREQVEHEAEVIVEKR